MLTLNPEGIYEYAAFKTEPTVPLLDELMTENGVGMQSAKSSIGSLKMIE